MQLTGWVIVAVTLGACQVVGGPDVSATLQADNQQILMEATTIARSAQADQASVAATADASMTTVADLQGSNLVLLATVRAGDPPSVKVVASTDQRAEVTPGQQWFLRTGLSQVVDPNDGCVVSPQISFSSDTPTIYMTIEGYNVVSGTRLTAVWEHEGTEVYRDSLVLSRSASEMCVWLSMDQTEVDFTPGNWTVRAFADDQQLGTPETFVIRAVDAMAGG